MIQVLACFHFSCRVHLSNFFFLLISPFGGWCFRVSFHATLSAAMIPQDDISMSSAFRSLLQTFLYHSKWSRISLSSSLSSQLNRSMGILSLFILWTWKSHLKVDIASIECEWKAYLNIRFSLFPTYAEDKSQASQVESLQPAYLCNQSVYTYIQLKAKVFSTKYGSWF